MREIDELRPMTAGRLLELWRESRELAEDGLERTLLCNARVLAACCFFQGEPVYGGEMEVLADLTGRQMATLLRRLAEGGAAAAARESVNPAFDRQRFEALGGV